MNQPINPTNTQQLTQLIEKRNKIISKLSIQNELLLNQKESQFIPSNNQINNLNKKIPTILEEFGLFSFSNLLSHSLSPLLLPSTTININKIITTNEFILPSLLHSLKELINKINSNKQISRGVEFSCSKSKWDFVLDEMEWMSVDFEQEKKIKIFCCFLIGKSVLDYFERKRKREGSLREEGRDGEDVIMGEFDITTSNTFTYDSTDLFYSKEDVSNDYPIYKPFTTTSKPQLQFTPLLYTNHLKQPFETQQTNENLYFYPPLIVTTQDKKSTNSSTSITSSTSFIWSKKKDEDLIQLVAFYGTNWLLLSEHFNCSPGDCEARYKLKHDKSTSATNPTTSNPSSLNELSKHITFFDFIKKKKPPTNTTTGTSTGSLNAHISHQAIASRAGVDPRRWKSVLEHCERRYASKSSLRVSSGNLNNLNNMGIPVGNVPSVNVGNNPGNLGTGNAGISGVGNPVNSGNLGVNNVGTMSNQQVQQVLGRGFRALQPCHHPVNQRFFVVKGQQQPGQGVQGGQGQSLQQSLRGQGQNSGSTGSSGKGNKGEEK